MTRVDNLGDEPDQIVRLVLDDGSIITLELIYRPTTQRWTFDLSWPGPTAGGPGLTVNGVNLCVLPNVLRPWRNNIPFGLLCSSTDGADPFYIEDFLSGRVSLYLMDAADLAAVEKQFFSNPA